MIAGGFTHVLVAIHKFTKWIEYKPITKISADRVVSFTCDIFHHFGFPNTTIIDLGSNFHSHEFWEFYENSAIEVKYVSVAHPRANGQVERAICLILDGLKKRLYDENSKKGASVFMSSLQLSGGFALNQAKPRVNRHSFSSLGQKLSSLRTSCGNLKDWRCMKKAKPIRQDIWSLTR
jgi:hypothetical protein